MCGDFITKPRWSGVVKKSPNYTEMNSKIGDFMVKSGSILAQNWEFLFLFHSTAGWVDFRYQTCSDSLV